MAVGQEAALRVTALRSNDGAFPLNPEVFIGSTEPGQWRPTQPTFQQPMSAPWMGGVTPFALKDVDGLLHEPGPPHLSSGLYARDYDEVKALGARFGSERTAAQTSLATFYSGNFFAQMNGIARSVALARLSDIGDTARLLALANVSAADALIVAWNNKRTYNFWRPSTAIFEGDYDGNPRTVGDPTWLPLFNDPPYPDYTSGANSITSAFMRTLALFFDDDAYTFTVTTTVAGQGTRHLRDASRRWRMMSWTHASTWASTSALPTRWHAARASRRPTGRSATCCGRSSDVSPLAWASPVREARPTPLGAEGGMTRRPLYRPQRSLTQRPPRASASTYEPIS